MKHTWILFCAALLAVCLYSSAFPRRQVPGFAHSYLSLCDLPGLCVLEIDPKVVRFRVEGKDPGFETVIWEGLPRVGDCIDTLGADRVELQAWYSFAPGEKELVGIGVRVQAAEWPVGAQQLRATCTVRAQNPGWDFSLLGKNFCTGGQPAAASGYRVRPGQTSGTGGKTVPSDPSKAGENLFDKYFDKSGTPPAESKKSPGSGAKGETGPTGAKEPKPKSGSDSLLGVQWPSGDIKKEGTAGASATQAPGRAPRTESEARQAIESMGFKILGPATFGAFQGFWIQIADRAKAAQFGFQEIKRARAVSEKESVTGTIGCWTERSGDQLIIWIDERDVGISNAGKLPAYVKLFSR